ncbi:MAG: hypothetical protein V7651_05300 [Hyphomonas oceanitis]|jgi:hypothetical protein|uniref:hypothetical protein n=1 Tax=Hyphomonas oceanitis TaxID=81033 RepID=UPI0030013728
MRNILIVALTAALCGGCSSLRPYDMNPAKVQGKEHLKELARGESNSTSVKWVSTNGRFRTLLLEASENRATADTARQYLSAGVAVADLYCRAYFEKLGEQRADQEALQGSFNITDGVASAALGFAEASAETISLVSVSFSSLEALFENIDAAYLVSPDIEQVEALVFAARDTLHARIFSDTSTLTYFEAERRLAAYHQLCTFNGVTRLVNEAVANGEPILQTNKSSARDQLFLTASAPVLQSLTSLLANDGSNFSMDDAKYIFAYYAGFSKDDGIADSVLEKVGNSLEGSTPTQKLTTLNDNRLSATALISQLDEMVGLKEPATEWANSVRTKTKKMGKLLLTLDQDVSGDKTASKEKSDLCNDQLQTDPTTEFGKAFVELSELTNLDETKKMAGCANAAPIAPKSPKLPAQIASEASQLTLKFQPPVLNSQVENQTSGLVVRIE